MAGRIVSRTLASRDGRKGRVVWDFIVDLPPKADGKRRRMVRCGFRTKAEAARRLAEIVATREGPFVEPSRLTVGEYLTRWVEGLTAEDLRTSTRRSYASHVRVHLIPHLGRARLQQLTFSDVKAAYAAMGEGGCSPASIRRIHATLRRALGDAVEDRLLPSNPAALPRKRLPRVPRPERPTWSVEELGRFLDHVSGDRLSALWTLAATTGLRRGELMGLRWEDVDREAGRVAVRQTLISLGHELHVSEPKNGKARTVDLDPGTLAILGAWRKTQATERIAWGEAYQDSGLVFTQENGEPVHPDWASKRFRRLAAAAGLPVLRFHDLRHGHASHLLASGVHPKVVQERLGHSSIQITMDLYSHVAEGLQAEGARKVGERVFAARAQGPAPSRHEDGRDGQGSRGGVTHIRR